MITAVTWAKSSFITWYNDHFFLVWRAFKTRFQLDNISPSLATPKHRIPVICVLVRWSQQSFWGQGLCSFSSYSLSSLEQCLAYSRWSGNIYLGLRSAFFQWSLISLKEIGSIQDMELCGYIFFFPKKREYYAISNIQQSWKNLPAAPCNLLARSYHKVFWYWLYPSFTYPSVCLSSVLSFLSCRYQYILLLNTFPMCVYMYVCMCSVMSDSSRHPGL